MTLISAALCNILPLRTTVLPDLNVNVLSKQTFQFHFCVSSTIQSGLVVRKPVFGFAIWYWLFQPACLATCSKFSHYSKTCVKRPLSKRPKIGFQDQLSLNAVQKYCRILQGEHSAILLTCIKPPFVIKFFALSIFEWQFYTGFTVYLYQRAKYQRP